jgi:hypothetical protein
MHLPLFRKIILASRKEFTVHPKDITIEITDDVIRKVAFDSEIKLKMEANPRIRKSRKFEMG